MGRQINKNNAGLQFLLQFWANHCALEDWHIAWARSHIKVLSKLKKNRSLYFEGETQRYVYFVHKGVLARVHHHPKHDKRQILSIALPGMALMTTDHLYSDTPSLGDIVVLRPNSSIIEIPYKAIKSFKEKEPNIDTLIDILGNKKRKQLAKLRLVSSGSETYENYLLFTKILPDLHGNLYHQEVADTLGISLSTAKRYHKRWLIS